MDTISPGKASSAETEVKKAKSLPSVASSSTTKSSTLFNPFSDFSALTGGEVLAGTGAPVAAGAATGTETGTAAGAADSEEVDVLEGATDETGVATGAGMALGAAAAALRASAF